MTAIEKVPGRRKAYSLREVGGLINTGQTKLFELIKSGKLLASGDFNGFIQGCIGTEIAVRNLRKQPTPNEVILKPIVITETNFAPYETPVEQRACPTLEQIVSN